MFIYLTIGMMRFIEEGKGVFADSQILVEFAPSKWRENWKWVSTTTRFSFFSHCGLSSCYQGKKKRNNLGICSSELVKTVEAVERLLSDQTALCVLLISWAVLCCISRSFFTGFRSEFRDLAFRKRSKLKNVHCFKAKDIKLQLKARNQHFVPSF